MVPTTIQYSPLLTSDEAIYQQHITVLLAQLDTLFKTQAAHAGDVIGTDGTKLVWTTP